MNPPASSRERPRPVPRSPSVPPNDARVFERFFSASPDLLAIAGTEGRLELVNQAWERQLGWTAEELTTTPFLDFVHPDDRARTIAEAEAVYRGHPAPSFRNRYRTKQGDYRMLEWRTRPIEGRLYCVVRDVTSRVEEERRMAWLAALVDSTADAVIGVQNDGVILSWNAGAEKLYGYGAAEMVGR
jgi:PAS domain S-box-containing protein